MIRTQSRGAGIGLRLTAAALVALMSACVHGAAAHASIGQIIFWRSAVALIPIVAYMVLRGELLSGLKTRNPRAHLTRSLFGFVTMVFSFVSLAYLPVANATALAYLVPILSLPAAAILLGERLSVSVIVASTLGFGGVVAMLAETLAAPETSTTALIGVGAGLAYAGTMALLRVHIRRMTETETPASIAFYFALTCSALGALSFPFGWPQPDAQTYLALIGAGIFGGVGHIVSTEASARAPVSTLAPFDYTGMIWALGLDALLFSHLPGIWSFVGVVAITLAGAIALSAPVERSNIDSR